MRPEKSQQNNEAGGKEDRDLNAAQPQRLFLRLLKTGGVRPASKMSKML
jgi:hypothetical protein